MATYHFHVTHRSDDTLGLAPMLREYAKVQPLADHLTPDQAAEVLLHRFTELVESELRQLEVRASRVGDEPATGESPGGPPPPDWPF